MAMFMVTKKGWCGIQVAMAEELRSWASPASNMAMWKARPRKTTSLLAVARNWWGSLLCADTA